MYLAGDIGGTKTHLALYENHHAPKIEKVFPSGSYGSLVEIVQEFLQIAKASVKVACFGIAGPVKDQVCKATNLPWIIKAHEIEKKLEIPHVYLINDLEANAYGIQEIEKKDLIILNHGASNQKGNQALVSAGTGLGEAGLFFDGKKHIPFACEGGHCDFAPKNELEMQLLIYLKKQFDHVSYERILSGPGIYNLYRFMIDEKNMEGVVHIEQEKEAPKIITDKGLSNESKACAEALNLFVSIYGSECGNAALKFFAIGGLFIGGGIAPKILSLMKGKHFTQGFLAKGRFASLLEQIPIHVINNENTALLGAKHYAKLHLRISH